MQTYQSAQLDALGDATRRAIVERLLDGPQSVGALARRLPVSRPAVSQHLRVLKEAGLVTEQRDGTRRVYSVDTASLAELRDYFDSFWSDALESFKQAVEQDEGRKK